MSKTATGKRTETTSVLLNVAWMALGLGVAMEILTVIAMLPSGKVSGLRAVLADTVQKVSWSWLVCVGVAAGSAASKLRVPMMGLAGLLAAPLAFQVARVLHKSASQTLGLAAPGGAGGPSPWVIALVKGLEYACLGMVLARIGRGRKGLGVHAAVGLACGIVFGGIILWLTISAAPAPMPLSAIAPRAVNELIFPLGCSMVFFGAEAVARRLREWSEVPT